MSKFKIFKGFLATFIVFSIVYLMSISENFFDFDLMFMAKEVDALYYEISLNRDENSRIKNELNSSKQAIDNIQEELISLNEDIIRLEDDINSLEIVSGDTDMRGEGISVIVADNLSDDVFNINDKIVHDFDIRVIINDLVAAGAEAISVNGKRILSTTEIICIGPVIRINGDAEAAPYIIKAIGNPDELTDAITNPESYAYDIRYNFGLDVTSRKSNDVNISKNNESFTVKYAKIYDEVE